MTEASKLSEPPIKYTRAEYKEFDRLTEMASSRIQTERISGRLRLSAFQREHGKEKCDAMWKEIQRRDRG